MTAGKLLLDSNIIVHVFNGHKPLARGIEGKVLYVSVVTRMELLAWPGENAARDRWVRKFLDECEVVMLDDEVEQHAIAVRKRFRLSWSDSVIAATAMRKNVALFTSDKRFTRLKDAAKVILVQP